MQKEKIDKFKSNLFFNQSEVWWCAVGVNIQQESCGKGSSFRRPVIIIKKFSRNLCLVVPLTTQIKYGTWYFELKIINTSAIAQLHQIRTVSTSRLTSKITTLSEKKFNKILLNLNKLGSR